MLFQLALDADISVDAAALLQAMMFYTFTRRMSRVDTKGDDKDSTAAVATGAKDRQLVKEVDDLITRMRRRYHFEVSRTHADLLRLESEHARHQTRHSSQ